MLKSVVKQRVKIQFCIPERIVSNAEVAQPFSQLLHLRRVFWGSAENEDDDVSAVFQS